VLIAFILSDKVETTRVEIQAHEWLHLEDEVGEIESMLYLCAVRPLNVDVCYELFDILLNAVVHDGEVLKPNESGVCVCS